MSVHSFAPVHVGHTDFPLKATGPRPDLFLPLPVGMGNPFRLLDGPPYANGALHLGHVFNKHLKDLAVRAHAAVGVPVQWTPRWDCHGLPVELNVEQAGHARSAPARFVPAARQYAQHQVDGQRATFQTLGLSADWEHPACTMDPASQAATLRLLADLTQRGQLDVRHLPTPWCPACRSTVAGAEQETRTVPRTSAVVPFFLESGDAVLSWTTTPWTLPSHAGLVLHPDALYQAFTWEGRQAWASQAAWAQVEQWYPGAQEVGSPCLGAALAGQAYTTPWGAAHQLVTDGGVAPAAGTGCLHAVPAFDAFDAAVGRKHGWPTTHVMGEDGRFSETAWAPLRGLAAGEPASTAVLDHLRGQPEVAHWLRAWTAPTEVPTCWRHKAPLLVRPSRQVFLVLDEAVRARALAMVEAVHFEPAAAKGRLHHMMATRPDWCVSRQRTWGVPMALVLDSVTGQPHAQASAVMRAVADQVQTHGVEVWWNSPLSRWLPEGLSEADVVLVPDVLDVWFDSGALGVHQGEPADLVVEGHDQLRGWFQACVWVAAALDRPVPFSHVVSHGFVVGADGRKLSKSEGGDRPAKGVPGWATLPADVVRVWAAMGEVGADRPWSLPAVTAAQQAYGRFRNTLRFALANVPTADWQSPMGDLTHWPTADRATLARGLRVRDQVWADLACGHHEPAVRAALAYADQELSRGLYVRLKDRLYCAPLNSDARLAAIAAVRACEGVMVDMLGVLTPQLVAEAFPEALPLRLDTLSLDLDFTPEQNAWLADAHQVRNAVSEAWEKLAQKGGLDRACLTVAVSAEMVWVPGEVEEAFGVGQWQSVGPSGMGGVSVPTPWGQGWVAPSAAPMCPRCRRPGPQTADDSVCQPCAAVARGETNWR